MQHSKNVLRFFSVAMIMGSALWLGCAAAPEAAAEAAPEEVAVEAAVEAEPDVDQQTRQAAELLAAAKDLLAQERYEDAGAPLAALVEMTDYLGESQKAELQQMREKVAAATGIMPGMSERERKAVAKEAYAAGMAAYKAGLYLDAQQHLDKAARMNVSLGWPRNGRLSRRRQKIAVELDELQAAYAVGKEAHAQGDYAAARAKLVKVQKSGVSLGGEVDRDVMSMLAGIDLKVGVQDVGALEAQARALEEQATAVIRIRTAVAAKKAEADTALADQDYEAAKGLLAELQALLSQPEATGLPGVADMAGQVGERIAVADQAAQEAARQQKAQQQIDDVFQSAAQLVDDDLLAAEAKIAEAQNMAAAGGIELTAEQVRLCDGVRAAVAARYGRELGVRRRQYAGLAETAGLYEGAGEYEKAIKTLELVKTASAHMIADGAAQQALGKLADLSAAAQGQTTAGERIVRWIDQASEELGAGQFDRALEIVSGALEQAQEANLSGAPLAAVLNRGAALLEGDFEKAVSGVPADVQNIVAAQLDAARQAAAYSHAEYYLAKNNPELAEPNLMILATSTAAPQYVDWAKGQLEVIERFKAQAPQARLMELEGELRDVYDLAQKLADLAREGQLPKVRSVEQKLAAARVRLELKRARLAIERGAVEEGTKTLAELPAEEVAAADAQGSYNALLERAEMLAGAAERLQAAEAALGECKLAEATEQLAAVDVGGPGAEPLVAWQEALAGVLDSARQAQEPAARAKAMKDDVLTTYADAQAAAERRSQAWQNYHAGLKAFLEGEADAALPALQRTMAEPAGVRSFESANAAIIIGVLADRVQVGSQAAEQVLDRAETSYDAGAYLKAASLLEELRAMPGFGMRDAVREKAARLLEMVQQKESAAQRVYAKAVAAHQAGDTQELRRALIELKGQYSGTRVYRDKR